jgi:hypothetical protein
MRRFYFHLRAAGTIHHDADGTDLPDGAAARAHATAVAQELMHHADRGKRHWSIRVENEHGRHELDLFFADVDPSLAAYSPQTRLLVIETCRRLSALTDVLCAARAARIEARILVARARGRPQLAYSRET